MRTLVPLLLRCCLLLAVLRVTVSLSGTSCSNGGAVYFGHLFANANGFGVPDVERAVQLAVDNINAAMPLLGYKLNHTAGSTQVSVDYNVSVLYAAISGDLD